MDAANDNTSGEDARSERLARAVQDPVLSRAMAIIAEEGRALPTATRAAAEGAADGCPGDDDL